MAEASSLAAAIAIGAALLLWLGFLAGRWAPRPPADMGWSEARNTVERIRRTRENFRELERFVRRGGARGE
jgi:membrane protein DedA with SNARE-associated domain